MSKKINIVVKLIIINVAIYLLVNLIGLAGEENLSKFIEWFAVPSNLKSLLFRPWTLFTYMFLHEDFMHILGNMLWLYFLGTLFITFIEPKRIIAVYLLGGLSGAALYIIAYNIAPLFFLEKVNGLNMGASAAISAIVIAISVYKSDFIIRPFGMFSISLKWLAIIFIALDILQLWGDNTGGHIAHLGGAIYGFWFGYKLTNKEETTDWLLDIFNSFTKKRKPRMKVKRNLDIPRSDYDYNKEKANVQEEMDRILDKISLSGYNSLTKKEKDFLFQFSEKK